MSLIEFILGKSEKQKAIELYTIETFEQSVSSLEDELYFFIGQTNYCMSMEGKLQMLFMSLASVLEQATYSDLKEGIQLGRKFCLIRDENGVIELIKRKPPAPFKSNLFN